MPSQLHDTLLLLFRNRPSLAAELLCEALHVELPTYTEARIHSPDITKSVEIAAAAQLASAGLDAERSRLYFDLIQNSLSEAARRALRTMNPAKYEYQSDFARKYYGQGKAEGSREALVAVVTKLLTLRFGALNAVVRARIEAASTDELNAVTERLLTAPSLDAALGSI